MGPLKKEIGLMMSEFKKMLRQKLKIEIEIYIYILYFSCFYMNDHINHT